MDEVTRSLKSFSAAIDGTFSTLASKATTGIATGLQKAVPRPARAPDAPGRAGAVSPAAPAPQVSQEEREAAQKRSDAALAALGQGYFSQGFDPLAHELSLLPEDAKQDDIDGVVERLTAAVDVSARVRCVLRVAWFLVLQQLRATAPTACAPSQGHACMRPLLPCKRRGFGACSMRALRPGCRQQADTLSMTAAGAAAGGQRAPEAPRAEEPGQADPGHHQRHQRRRRRQGGRRSACLAAPPRGLMSFAALAWSVRKGRRRAHAAVPGAGGPSVWFRAPQATCVMVQAARQQLRMAAEEVSSQIMVVGATRKKQRLMGALELASRVKAAKDLHAQLK